MLSNPVGVSIYDFDFRQYFDCRTPYHAPDRMAGVARIGAFEDYPALYQSCAEQGIDLVHSPEDQLKCSSLPKWYPHIADLTPRSQWFTELPEFAEIESAFELPVFIKGARQTSRHKAELSIIRSREEYEAALEHFRSDPILRWQDFVCREFLSLRPVRGGVEGKVPASYEFRTFWWRGELVGAGRYWFEAEAYQWTNAERDDALAVAGKAVEALHCTFLVIDLAQTEEGEWIVIECNDGMESGYAGASPFVIWQEITEIEKRRLQSG